MKSSSLSGGVCQIDSPSGVFRFQFFEPPQLRLVRPPVLAARAVEARPGEALSPTDGCYGFTGFAFPHVIITCEYPREKTDPEFANSVPHLAKLSRVVLKTGLKSYQVRPFFAILESSDQCKKPPFMQSALCLYT